MSKKSKIQGLRITIESCGPDQTLNKSFLKRLWQEIRNELREYKIDKIALPKNWATTTCFQAVATQKGQMQIVPNRRFIIDNSISVSLAQNKEKTRIDFAFKKHNTVIYEWDSHQEDFILKESVSRSKSPVTLKKIKLQSEIFGMNHNDIVKEADDEEEENIKDVRAFLRYKENQKTLEDLLNRNIELTKQLLNHHHDEKNQLMKQKINSYQELTSTKYISDLKGIVLEYTQEIANNQEVKNAYELKINELKALLDESKQENVDLKKKKNLI